MKCARWPETESESANLVQALGDARVTEHFIIISSYGSFWVIPHKAVRGIVPTYYRSNIESAEYISITDFQDNKYSIAVSYTHLYVVDLPALILPPPKFRIEHRAARHQPFQLPPCVFPVVRPWPLRLFKAPALPPAAFPVCVFCQVVRQPLQALPVKLQPVRIGNAQPLFIFSPALDVYKRQHTRCGPSAAPCCPASTCAPRSCA